MCNWVPLPNQERQPLHRPPLSGTRLRARPAPRVTQRPRSLPRHIPAEPPKSVTLKRPTPPSKFAARSPVLNDAANPNLGSDVPNSHLFVAAYRKRRPLPSFNQHKLLDAIALARHTKDYAPPSMPGACGDDQ